MVVSLQTTATHHEIANGLVGVRVPLAVDLARPLGPIDGIRYRDGVWTATAPSYLQSRSWFQTPAAAPPPCTGRTVTVIENAPTRAVVKVRWTFDKPAFDWSHVGVFLPAGPGYHETTLTVLDGEPVVLVEEDGDCDLGYSLDVWPGLQPTRGRYRGSYASAVEYGREPDGQRYRGVKERGPLDATVDLDYAKPRRVSTHASADTRPAMATWNPWIVDSGWYWQIYNHLAQASANLIGIFAGPASRLIGGKACGAGIWHGPGNAAGITVELNRVAPDLVTAPRNRFVWGLFVSTKADLLEESLTQPIGRMMHRHGGLALKLASYEKEFTDPAAGYGTLYTGRATLQALAQRVRDDGATYQRLYTAEPGARPLMELWRQDTPEALTNLIGPILTQASELKQELVHGEGIYDHRWHYIQGGHEAIRALPMIDQCLASPHATATQRSALKKAAHLFGSFLWDDDVAPLHKDASGGLIANVNLGTANMPIQMGQYRDSYALFLGTDPAWQPRAAGVKARTMELTRAVIHTSGAPNASCSYLGTNAAPCLSTLLQLQAQGGTDPFAEDTRFGRFGECLLALTTPRDRRFGGYRKLVVYGDGDNHGESLHGVMAAALKKANPSLSALLQQAWDDQGRPHSQFFGSTLLMTDDTLPMAPLPVSRMQGTFAGFGSAQRHRMVNGQESSLLVIDGHHYVDHRPPDQGMVALYLLDAPVSVSWGSFYSPHVPGGLWRSAVQLDTTVWNQAELPYDAGQEWWESTTTPGLFKLGTTTWKRSVKLAEASGFPVVAGRDDSVSNYIWTLNLMATGLVTPPSGTAFTPPAHPAAPKIGSHNAGSYRWILKGPWGVDFHLWLFPSKVASWAWSAWSHNWAPGEEQRQFREANGRDFEEAQYTLRLRTSGQLTWALVPILSTAPRDGIVRKTTKGIDVVYGPKTAITL